MSVTGLFQVSVASIREGAIPFSLYTLGNGGRTVLYARESIPITAKQIDYIKTSGKPLYLLSSSEEAYFEYATAHLRSIIEDPDVSVEQKARVLHDYGKISVKKLLDKPESREAHTQAEKAVDMYVLGLVQTPEAANNLFAISAMDSYTYSHSVNVATLNMLVARSLFDENEDEMKRYGMAGMLHDIGKTKCDSKILLKPGKLNNEEFSHVKMHAVYSEDILAALHYDTFILRAARNHHERWDGTGYPDRLAGEAIPMSARVTAVSDVYDAITSKRVYKEAGRNLDALKLMIKDEGHFDQTALNGLLSVVLQSQMLVQKLLAKR